MKPDHRVHGIVEGKDWAPNSTPLLRLSAVPRVDKLSSHPRLRKNEMVYPSPNRHPTQSLARASRQVFRVSCPERIVTSIALTDR
jgi:hypothetical protein